MCLYGFDETSFSTLARSRVKDVSTGLLFYLYSGRNAWHSTWITRYTDGCMHSGLQLAKDTAEQQRTQGSMFYIAELPALIIRSLAGVIVVTEINSRKPLLGYSPVSIRTDASLGMQKAKQSRYCFIERGARMLGAVRSFDYASAFWNKRPPPRNAIIVTAGYHSEIRFDPLPERPLQLLCSYSRGRQYRLGWSIVKDRFGRMDTEPVRMIAAHFVRKPEQASL